MTVDISFDFAKVYNIEKADVVKGQKFKLLSDFAEGLWPSFPDPVLTIKVDGSDAEVTADNTGTAIIFIMNAGFYIVKTLTINVVDEPGSFAAALNPTADKPVPK